MTADEFEDLIAQECAFRGVKLLVSPGSFVRFGSGEGTKSNGYFFEGQGKEPSVLAYAKGKPFEKWFDVAVHEFNHMCQWSSNSQYWLGISEADTYIWPWLRGEIELSTKRARKFVMSNLRCELDCDRRTVRMAKRLDLPGNWDFYAKKANAYVYFYHLLLKHRKWYRIGNEPYNIPAIVEAMPNHFNNDYSRISKKMEALYEECMPHLK